MSPAMSGFAGADRDPDSGFCAFVRGFPGP